MLEAYGTGTGIAIGVAAVTLPAVAVFGVMFSADGYAEERSLKRALIIGEGLGLVAALACAYYAGGTKSGTVGRGILYGLSAPLLLYGLDKLLSTPTADKVFNTPTADKILERSGL